MGLGVKKFGISVAEHSREGLMQMAGGSERRKERKPGIREERG